MSRKTILTALAILAAAVAGFRLGHTTTAKADTANLKRVTGIGGIFFKAHDPKKMSEWYEKHLGLAPQPGAGVNLRWREFDNPDIVGTTAWSIFKEDSKYFNPSKAPFMINYRVDNLDALLEALRAEGVEIDPKRQDADYGRFAWIMDPEGNRIELWEPHKK